jgi:hypothetical protein
MLVSGAIFLAYPEQHYNEEGWGVLLKYSIYFPLIILSSFYIIINQKINKNLLLFLLWILVCSITLILGMIDKMRYALYVMPAFSALAPQWIHKETPKIAYAALWIAALGAIYEYAVLGGFPRFHPNGYRAVSVFVNPNNLGITTVILYYFTESLQKYKRFFSLIIGISLIIISGSKTAFIIFFVLFLIRRVRITLLQAAHGIIFSFSAICLAFYIGIIPLESLYIRLDQYSNFFNSIDGFIFITKNENFYENYADNAFIQLWIEVGILGSISYIFIIIYCAARDGFRKPLWLLFAAASMTTNVPFLFPLGYIFWFYTGQDKIHKQKPKTTHP